MTKKNYFTILEGRSHVWCLTIFSFAQKSKIQKFSPSTSFVIDCELGPTWVKNSHNRFTAKRE